MARIDLQNTVDGCRYDLWRIEAHAALRVMGAGGEG